MQAGSTATIRHKPCAPSMQLWQTYIALRNSQSFCTAMVNMSVGAEGLVQHRLGRIRPIGSMESQQQRFTICVHHPHPATAFDNPGREFSKIGLFCPSDCLYLVCSACTALLFNRATGSIFSAWLCFALGKLLARSLRTIELWNTASSSSWTKSEHRCSVSLGSKSML